MTNSQGLCPGMSLGSRKVNSLLWLKTMRPVSYTHLGNTSDASEPKVATDTTAPAKPEVKTDLTGKAGTKDPVEVLSLIHI